ncbi:MAG: BTAD domain-containing putative transcriptional regulator, partial [Ilumatobacteraceae bacterium]
MFDPDDIDAALAELDARYLAGDAATHAHTWSVVAEAHTAFNRRELPMITPDFLDHRPLVTVETGDPTAKIREMWEFTPDLKLYIEAVHRLSDRGAVFTQASHGTSRAGFEAEWRVVEVVTVGGDSVIRGELFDETDLDTALARFDELNRRTLRLENAASQLYERFKVCFAARDWEAMVEILSDGVATDDRRRVVNAGVRVGRDAVLTEVLSFVEFGSYAIVSDVIATRGDRLVLNRSEILGENHRPHEFDTSVLEIIEIDVDGRLIARVAFDSDDVDTAFAELDRRYLAGDAAVH